MSNTHPFIQTIFTRARSRCQCRLPLCGHGRSCGHTLHPEGLGRTAYLLPMNEVREDPHPDDYLLLCDSCFARWMAHSGLLPQKPRPREHVESVPAGLRTWPSPA